MKLALKKYSFLNCQNLEFQVLDYPGKFWIDKKRKNFEDYLSQIYDYLEKDSIKWKGYQERQKIKEYNREIQRK
jgi:hypothetical protein